MQVPAEFAARLERAFQGRLRLRWSEAKNEFHLEQRVGRALANIPSVNRDDERIRAREGYLFILAVQPTTRMGCPRCSTTVTVPIREFREVACPLCRLQGREYKFGAGHFPLNDDLITYITSLDPERGVSGEQRARLNRVNEAQLEQERKNLLNPTLDAFHADFSRIAGIPSVGRTGKETWDAKTSTRIGVAHA